MEAKTVIVVCILFVLYTSFSDAKPKRGNRGVKSYEHKPNGWKMCLNQTIETEQIKSANLTCQAELESVLNLGANPTHKQLKKAFKNQCFRACLLEKLGLVANNALDKNGVSTFVDATFPESVRQIIKDQMSACSSTVESTGLSTTEEKCKSYKPLTKCLDKAVKKNCKGSMMNMNMTEPLTSFTPIQMPITTMMTPTASQRKRRETSMGDEKNDSSSSEETDDDDSDED